MRSVSLADNIGGSPLEVRLMVLGARVEVGGRGFSPLGERFEADAVVT